jgi:protocatechuate 3,4-dioxygenase beta subunit
MDNKRRDFIKLTGLAGIAALVPFGNILAKNGGANSNASCTLIPSETAGPFPLDLTANTFYFRQDVRESKAGAQLNLKLKIIGTGNCAPIQNVRVNIWHCEKDGFYSGYDNAMNVGQAGLTYLRGYQMADANGEVNFGTIFPGWYNGRTCHIHFQVYVSSAYSAISQLTFDVASKNAVYVAHASIYTKGADPLSPSADNIFSDGYTYQVATLTPNSTTGGYDSYLEVAVQGNGTVGIGHIEKENAKQFTLGQNYPNPFSEETIIPLTLRQASDVTLDLFDLSGKKVAAITRNNLPAGEQPLKINMRSIGLSTANYLYQVEIKNPNGIFREYKMMTANK